MSELPGRSSDSGPEPVRQSDERWWQAVDLARDELGLAVSRGMGVRDKKANARIRLRIETAERHLARAKELL